MTDDTPVAPESHENQGSETSEQAAPVTPAETQKKRWPWITAIAVVVVAAAGIGIAALLGAFASEPEPTAAPTATIKPTSTPEPTPTPTPTPAPADPVVNIESVEHMPYSEVWNPPDGGEYFWQVVDPANGYPETGGTPFVLAHACEDQECAGDELLRLEQGGTLTFLGETYQVQEAREIMKDDIADQDIWYHDPDRLVIITCIIETTWDESDKNALLIATRV